MTDEQRPRRTTYVEATYLRPPRRRRPSRRWTIGTAVIAAVVTALAGALAASGVLDAGEDAVAQPTPSASAASSAPESSAPPAATPAAEGAGERPRPAGRSARELLDALPVKGSAPGTGYSRVLGYGESWLDVDGNGCDTRNDILQRDLTHLELDGPCRVMSGILVSPYTGETIDFRRGVDTSHLVQIDHVVALKDSWRTGAQQLTDEQRVALANDPVNLLAVDGSSNAQKGDGNAATWLPKAKGFRCEYVARQISVKAAYRLWVVPAERDAMARILDTCPDQEAYASTLAPTVMAEPPSPSAAPDEREGTDSAPVPVPPAAPPGAVPAPQPPSDPVPSDPAPPEPSDPVPSDPAPPHPAPSEPAPTEPSDPRPSEPTPTEPTDPRPSDPQPSEPVPPAPAPTEPGAGAAPLPLRGE